MADTGPGDFGNHAREHGVAENALGTPGSASRRSFHGPGSLNFDLALLRSFPSTFGPAAANGEYGAATFGQVVQAASPRLMQVAVKLAF